MDYELKNDPYLDGETKTLINLLGINNPERLAIEEGDISLSQIISLAEHPLQGNFDLDHLQAVHRYIFGSIYPWAGELRTVELSLGDTSFARMEHLPKAAKIIFDELASEKFLADLSDEDFPIRLAHYYSEVNILHPFREGNGRTQRAFLSLLAAQSGREIAWDKMDKDQNIEASVAAYNDDERYLVKMLAPLISHIDE